MAAADLHYFRKFHQFHQHHLQKSFDLIVQVITIDSAARTFKFATTTINFHRQSLGFIVIVSLDIVKAQNTYFRIIHPQVDRLPFNPVQTFLPHFIKVTELLQMVLSCLQTLAAAGLEHLLQTLGIVTVVNFVQKVLVLEERYFRIEVVSYLQILVQTYLFLIINY